MYKISGVDRKNIDAHLDLLEEKARRLMADFRDGKLDFEGSLGRNKAIHFVFRVIPKSPTWFFLDKYSQSSYLKKLLTGSWKELLEIVDDVNTMMSEKIWKQKLTKEKYEKRHYQAMKISIDGTIVVDNFNDILRHIFVEELYEKEFDKYQFVKNMNLKVCPYCGRQKINVASIPNKRVSKPPIDHFLPKSKYPFLAVSFYNLIPCCTTCNDMANKGEFDPLDGDVGLENPYDFVDGHVRFEGIFPDFDYEMDEDKYDVNMHFMPLSLSKGYKDSLKLEEFYRDEKTEMIDMYSNMIHFSEGRSESLKAIGIDVAFMNDFQRRVVGIPLDGKASVRLLYKFKKELFEQLVKMFHISDS